ncbi:3-ketoacyl-CoA thiolase, mitochondrial [Cichlidogyrus casuarinus]|uniref:3-ketoacyl-CoA thiolase, mitochondrial n=1 Tax=Cichlidogyrus casuarinus TaxID=1844966 RepID=A0ABD2QRC6_9PLAT
MTALKSGVFIVSAKRTAFGAFGGKLKSISCTSLGEVAAKSCISAINLDPKLIDTVVFGNVIQSNKDTAYLARHVALRAGSNISTPALTLNRLCGSGFQAIISAIHDLLIGGYNIALAGGSENMSEVPFVVRDVRFGTRLGIDYKFEDPLMGTLFDHHVKTPMAITAENLAKDYKLSREDCDRYALQSQQRWKKAFDSGVFTPELAPITLKGKKGPEEFLRDEHPRDTTTESLAKLPPVFLKDGVVTAGNASGVCDGAGALLLVTEEALSKHNLTPLARVSAYSISGCDPTRMGIGPVPAIDSMMKALGKDRSQINNHFDLIEVNEAFAAQYLAVEKELGLDPSKTNINGGAISLGHPVGASGARIMTHLAHQMAQNSKIKKTVGSACIGGGQGIAIALESPN